MKISIVVCMDIPSPINSQVVVPIVIKLLPVLVTYKGINLCCSCTKYVYFYGSTTSPSVFSIVVLRKSFVNPVNIRVLPSLPDFT